MRYRVLWLAALMLGMAGMAHADMTFYLQSDIGVIGNMHYCRYSNNKTYTVNATQMCPMSVQDSGYSTSDEPTQYGTLTGQYQDGMTRICVYNVYGQRRDLRVDAYDICPPSHMF